MPERGERYHRSVKAALEFSLTAKQLERREFGIGRRQRVYRARSAGMKSIQFVGPIAGVRTTAAVSGDGRND